jgi:hypothetical protein
MKFIFKLRNLFGQKEIEISFLKMFELICFFLIIAFIY